MNKKEVWGYLNTRSSAGPITQFKLTVGDIVHVRCWHNLYGNPSYTYQMRNGDIYYAVDDFGGMNDLGHMSRDLVSRKKDLFPSWM